MVKKEKKLLAGLSITWDLGSMRSFMSGGEHLAHEWDKNINNLPAVPVLHRLDDYSEAGKSVSPPHPQSQPLTTTSHSNALHALWPSCIGQKLYMAEHSASEFPLFMRLCLAATSPKMQCGYWETDAFKTLRAILKLIHKWLVEVLEIPLHRSNQHS